MRKEPTISTVDLVIKTKGEPYITGDFSAINTHDPREPHFGIAAPVRGTDEGGDKNDEATEQNNNNETAPKP